MTNTHIYPYNDTYFLLIIIIIDVITGMTLDCQPIQDNE